MKVNDGDERESGLLFPDKVLQIWLTLTVVSESGSRWSL